MAFNINDMRAHLVGDGARPSQFRVQITNPINGSGDPWTPFMIKASSLPASTISSIPVPYFGRKIHVAGDRTFEEWSVTIINDENFVIRNAMEDWMNKINSHIGNLRETGSSSPEDYKAQAQITQYSKTGEILREYQFNGMFPTNIAAIDMDWNQPDAIEEFQVTFQYDWWDIKGGSTGNPIT